MAACMALTVGCPLFSPPPAGDTNDNTENDNTVGDPIPDDNGNDNAPPVDIEPAEISDVLAGFVTSATGGQVDLDDLRVGDEIVLSLPDNASSLSRQVAGVCTCAWSVDPASAGVFTPADECTTTYRVANPGPATLRVEQTCNGNTFAFLAGLTAQDVEPAGIPVADAGDNQTVDERSAVMLDGTESGSSSGLPVTFLWAQTGGPTVVLADAADSTASFTAPLVDCPQTNTVALTFELTVTEGDNSDTASTIVTVRNIDNCSPPGGGGGGGTPAPPAPQVCTVENQLVNCNDNNACTDDRCENFACVHPPVADTVTCNDNNICTDDDECAAGVCVGTPRSCAEFNNLNNCIVGVCDTETGECETGMAPAGTTCNDSSICTTNDQCNAAGMCGGADVDCSAFTDACNVGMCNDGGKPQSGGEVGGCFAQPANQGATCSDGDVCTTNDQCNAGTCGGTPVAECCTTVEDCGDDNMCTDDVCMNNMCQYPDNNTPCNDGDSCTNDDACATGECGGTPVDCSQLTNACNVGVCSGGECSAESTNDGGACNDGNACTTGDVCNAGACAGTAVDCSNLNDACSVGVCNGGVCGEMPINQDGACDDAMVCTNNDHCNAGNCVGDLIGGCQACDGNEDCQDGSDCTTNTCVGGMCRAMLLCAEASHNSVGGGPICNGTVVELHVSPTSPGSGWTYSWNCNPAIIPIDSLLTANPKVLVTETTNCTITITVNNGMGTMVSDTTNIPVSANAAPFPVVTNSTFPDAPVCPDEPVQLTGPGGFVSYGWKCFRGSPDNPFVSTEQNPVYNAPTDSDCWLSVFNGTCEGTNVTIVQVLDPGDEGANACVP